MQMNILNVDWNERSKSFETNIISSAKMLMHNPDAYHFMKVIQCYIQTTVDVEEYENMRNTYAYETIVFERVSCMRNIASNMVKMCMCVCECGHVHFYMISIVWTY